MIIGRCKIYGTALYQFLFIGLFNAYAAFLLQYLFQQTSLIFRPVLYYDHRQRKIRRQWLQNTFGLVLFDETLYLLAEMPSHISALDVVIIAAMAMVFALAASLYPAVRASRLDPVEGLRRE